MIFLSTHFTLDELVVSQYAAREGWDNTPPAPSVAELRRLVGIILEPIRHEVGDRALVVSSGYRSPRVNAAIGGAPASAHVDGRAADFTVPGIRLLTLFEVVAKADLPFDQLIYEYGRWVHAGIARIGETPRRQLLMKFAGRGYELFDPEKAAALT